MKKIKNYINGSNKYFSDKFLDVDDPSKGENIAEVVLSSKKDFEEVLVSSQNAFLIGQTLLL